MTEGLEAALIAGSASVTVGLIAAYASARQGERTRKLQRELAENQQSFDTRLEEFKNELDRQAKAEEKALNAEQALELFRVPLQRAAEDLAHRIRNIREEGFLGYVESDNRRREIAVLSTAYRFARYFGTLEQLYDRAEFLSLERRRGGDSNDDGVVGTLAAIGRAFSDDELDQTEEDDSRFMIWREEQRAMGELARDHDRDALAGFATFAARATGPGKRWFANFVDDLEAGGAEESQRLQLVQSLLERLVQQLDPDGSEQRKRGPVDDDAPRNLRMAERIGAAPVRYPFSFVIAGDSGAWPDPTADAIFAQLVRQTAALDPAPVFFANLGDFAGPGTRERHEHYLQLVAPLSMPNFCLLGNHDLEDPPAADAWSAVHGPRSFQFAYGNTHFVAIDGGSGHVGELGDTTPADTAGPSVEALRFLDDALAAATEPHRVVLLHAPPHLDGHYAPQPECGFRQGEPEFLDIVRRHGVRLVCCAHGLGFDHHVRDGIRFVMSGGGGAALYLSYRSAPGRDRGAPFHAVEITVAESGAVGGRVIQAFAPRDSPPPFSFGET